MADTLIKIVLSSEAPHEVRRKANLIKKCPNSNTIQESLSMNILVEPVEINQSLPMPSQFLVDDLVQF